MLLVIKLKNRIWILTIKMLYPTKKGVINEPNLKRIQAQKFNAFKELYKALKNCIILDNLKQLVN